LNPVYLSVPIGELTPNPWNPNEMDDELYRKARTSIRKFGFIDPITVREFQDPMWQIIDGEQRWRAAQDEGLEEVDIANLGVVDDATAEQLTIIFNELHGVYDPKKMGVLLTQLVISEPLPELLEVLPFDKAIGLAREDGLNDWQALQRFASDWMDR